MAVTIRPLCLLDQISERRPSDVEEVEVAASRDILVSLLKIKVTLRHCAGVADVAFVNAISLAMAVILGRSF